MSQPCPPAPSYIRAQGISDCDYLQLGPAFRRKMHDENLVQSEFTDLLSNNPNGYYKIGGLPMLYNNPAPRLYGTHLGRSVLSEPAAVRFNKGPSSLKPKLGSAYSSTIDPNFIRDLWTAQLVAYWITDGNWFSEYGQSGMVTKNNKNPSDLSPLGIDSNGQAIIDVRALLNPAGNNSVLFVKGPDGMFGKDAESLLIEYIRQDKILGKSIPSLLAVNTFNQLVDNVSTPRIEEAKEARRNAGGNVVPPVDKVPTPCNELNAEARQTRPDCMGQGEPPLIGGRTPPSTPIDKKLVAGILGVALLVAGSVYVYRKRSR